ncbi:MAG: hypothetical protein ACI8RZ_000355 [Myxococcota bacterium]|jgi:hypothetical protein
MHLTKIITQWSGRGTVGVMLILLLACGDKDGADSGVLPVDSGDPVTDTDTDTDTASDCTPDGDGDGYCDDDCDDADPDIHPDASESCNEVDDDCDGEIDEGAGPTWYLDEDGDGYGGEALVSCDAPDAYADNGADCDDDDDTVYPGAEELADGQDNDCDDEIDEGITEALAMSVSWSGGGLTVSITGGSGAYELGIAETGEGVSGWYGESCIPGDEPRGYDDYGYEVCHSLSATGGFITSVYPEIGDVGTNLTLFQQDFAPNLTYFLGETGSADCWVMGEDVSYYSDFGCQTL